MCFQAVSIIRVTQGYTYEYILFEEFCFFFFLIVGLHGKNETCPEQVQSISQSTSDYDTRDKPVKKFKNWRLVTKMTYLCICSNEIWTLENILSWLTTCKKTKNRKWIKGLGCKIKNLKTKQTLFGLDRVRTLAWVCNLLEIAAARKICSLLKIRR